MPQPATAKSLRLAATVLAGFLAARAPAGDWLPGAELLRTAAEERGRMRAEANRARTDLGLDLRPWACIGPFKDRLQSTIEDSFLHVFEPEEDLLAPGSNGRPDFAKVYDALPCPGMSDTRRAWHAFPEWTDGYRHLLPRGPAPSENETVYLFRTIHARRPGRVLMRIYAEDYLGARLNGTPVGRAVRDYGPHRYPVPLVVPLDLREGENRLLVKITSMYGARGFAFALDGFTPTHTLLPLEWSSEIRNDDGSNFHPGDTPYAAAEPRRFEATPDADPAATVATALGVPPETIRDALPADPHDLQNAATFFRNLSSALRRLRRFRFTVEPVPMFDPPVIAMDDRPARNAALSPDAREYADESAALKPRVDEALDRFERGDPDGPGAVLAAAAAIDAMWRSRIADLPPIVFLRCPEFGVNAIAPYSAQGAEPASICVFAPAAPDEPPRVVFHEPGTRIYDLNLSYDAKTVFFSAIRPGVEGGWHVYAIGTDGTGLRQITSGACRDISPLPLPDGRLMFVSDRADTWVQCQAQKAGLLYTCNRDGTGVRRVSANIDSDHSPAIMNDGRVLFTRWDYGVEKNVFARHALWSMNPDGTGLRLFFGNTIEDPGGFWEARAIPGRPEVVVTLGPHHSYHAGMIGLARNTHGPEAPRGTGFRFVTDEIPVYCDTTFAHGYRDPYPVNERLFLVSYGGDGQRKGRLYLLDDRGNRKCVYEAEGNLGCRNPILVRPRTPPPIIPSQCDNPEWAYRDPEDMNRNPDDSWGTLLVGDVYRGIEPTVARGRAAGIRVMEQVQKSRCMAHGEAWGHTPIIGRGTVHVRRVVGTVPVEADGSAHFRVPALRSISLDVVDAEGRTLMRMGSDMHLMPGETQGCVGCHENRYGGVAGTGPPTGSALAARKPPITPQPPDWGTNGIVDYQRVVQPVWDRYCVDCHGGPTPKAGMDLSGDRTRFFCVSYDNLVDRGAVDFIPVFARGHDETAPLTVGSPVSPLSALIATPKHAGREIAPEDRQRVHAWIDANIPYYGTYDYCRVDGDAVRGIGARDSWETDIGHNTAGWLVGGVAATFERRCLGCHRREVRNQGLWGFGGGPSNRTMEVSSNRWTDRGVTAHMFAERYPMSAKVGPEFRINLTRPEHSLLLQAPLAAAAGGLGMCANPDGSPVFATAADPDYAILLGAIDEGHRRLYEFPRVDMDEPHVAAVRAADAARPKRDTPDWREQAARHWAETVKALGMVLSPGLRPAFALPPNARNLARTAAASSPDGVPLEGPPPRVSVEAAIDGDPGTYWDDEDRQPLYRLRLDFPEPVTLAALSLTGWNHHDCAPRDFTILCDDREIGRVTGAVYARNRLSILLPETECRSLELAIDGYYLKSPAIRELEAYGPDATP